MKSILGKDWAAACAAGVLLFACGGSTSPQGAAPEGHTVNQHGVFHRPGLEDPLVNCTGCHGARLEGGKGPSCTQCHGKKW